VTTTNTLAEVCEAIGADWSEIAPALRLDRRIGPHAYLQPGLWIAGGNLERDLVTVLGLAEQHGTEAGVVRAWQQNSAYRRDWALRAVHREVLGRAASPALAIWGIAYKRDTHSIKNSPSIELMRALPGLPIRVHDPVARFDPGALPHASLVGDPLDALRGADALVIMTPWQAYGGIAPAEIKGRLRGRLVLDPHGVLDPAACRAAGLDQRRLGC
jgi:UDPglucose 6-dehydrogenase